MTFFLWTLPRPLCFVLRRRRSRLAAVCVLLAGSLFSPGFVYFWNSQAQANPAETSTPDQSSNVEFLVTNRSNVGKNDSSEKPFRVSSRKRSSEISSRLQSIQSDIDELRERIDRLRSTFDQEQIENQLTLQGHDARNQELTVTEEHKNFWSFRPLSRPDPPAVKNKQWIRNGIDQFILAALEQEGLEPAPPIDRTGLIRRLYFDLIGIPPLPREVQKFVSDLDPSASDRLVDQLLESPHFGERWGRHWLDVARYADSGGYEFDVERPNAYPYRDFVIRAINQDLPYDIFLKWQLAGDEYEPGNPDAIAATGFCTSGPTISNQENEKNRYDELDDILATTGSAALGLTIGCARCHDHKYDPIPQRDYYRLLAAFTTSKRQEAYLLDSLGAEQARRLERSIQEAIKKTKQNLDEFLAPAKAAVREAKIQQLSIPDEDRDLLLAPKDDHDERQAELLELFEKEIRVSDEDLKSHLSELEIEKWEAINTEIKNQEKRLTDLPQKALSLTDSQPEPAESFFLARGDPDRKKEALKPGVLTVLNRSWNIEKWVSDNRPQDASTTYRRMALAEWLTDVENGAGALAARVIVNRLWANHFGRGIVRTPGDFGVQGERPSHPELLEWLASELVEGGWRLKRIHRLILESSVYRQGIDYDPEKALIDPENRLLWRRRPVRLQSEVIRDTILATSGALNRRLYGPPVFPRMHPDAIATGTTPKWPLDAVDGPKTWRRSVYLFVRRSALLPLMTVFDGPDATQSCTRRNTTIVPTQALELLNDDFSRDQSRLFAERVVNEVGNDVAKQMERAFWLALQRPPEPQEGNSAMRYLLAGAPSAEENSGNAPADGRLAGFCQALFNLNEFIYID